MIDEAERGAIESALNNPRGETGGAIEYQSGDNFLYRLHPATKLTLVIGIVAVVFLFGVFQVPLIILILLMIGLLWFRYYNVIRTGFLLSLPFGISLLVVHGLFNPSNETPLFVLQTVPVIDKLIIWEEGIRFGLLFYFRLTSIIISILTLIRTTHPRKLSIGLENKGIPSKLTYVFMSALQLAPQIKNQARSIAEAQQARGLDTGGNLLERLKSLIAMMIPLFISMLITTQTRALALESRGFSRDGPRSALLQVEDTKIDRVIRWGTLIVVIGFIIRQVTL